MSSFCSRLCVYCKLPGLERSGEQGGRKNGRCGPKISFLPIPFLEPQIAHFGLAPSARLSLHDECFAEVMNVCF